MGAREVHGLARLEEGGVGIRKDVARFELDPAEGRGSGQASWCLP